MGVLTLFGSVLSLALAPFVEFPAPAARPLLALTIGLHTAYHLSLATAYDHGDLGQVYPIARGSAPLLVAAGALAVAGERLGLLAAMGVLCLASGVMVLALEHGSGMRRNPRAVTYALVTGALIASYTVVDGLGVRRAGSVLGFAVWLTIGDGLLTFLVISLWKGRQIVTVAKRSFPVALAGSAMQLAAYWIVLWALSAAPMASVSALRETSVLFAALMSTFLLREGFGAWRFVSAVLVTLGLVATRMG
ncbi:MAG: EamA family transporter [bacterium]|nr:MAG: EamA family transporter [bacterium]